jgi:hypothetical protein
LREIVARFLQHFSLITLGGYLTTVNAKEQTDFGSMRQAAMFNFGVIAEYDGREQVLERHLEG